MPTKNRWRRESSSRINKYNKNVNGDLFFVILSYWTIIWTVILSIFIIEWHKENSMKTNWGKFTCYWYQSTAVLTDDDSVANSNILLSKWRSRLIDRQELQSSTPNNKSSKFRNGCLLNKPTCKCYHLLNKSDLVVVFHVLNAIFTKTPLQLTIFVSIFIILYLLTMLFRDSRALDNCINSKTTRHIDYNIQLARWSLL